MGFGRREAATNGRGKSRYGWHSERERRLGVREGRGVGKWQGWLLTAFLHVLIEFDGGAGLKSRMVSCQSMTRATEGIARRTVMEDLV